MENNQRNNLNLLQGTAPENWKKEPPLVLNSPLSQATGEETVSTEYVIKNQLTGKELRYSIPDKIHVDPEWTILGNLELDGWNLIGDPFFNVVAYKINKKGIHNWAIGWEHPVPSLREKNPGFGFEDGHYLRSAEYIPLAYVIGPLIGMQERTIHTTGEKRYYVDQLRSFEHKPLWRFRGQKTWLEMEPDSVITKLREDLDRRFIRQTLFQRNFDLQALGWLHEASNTLYMSAEMAYKDMQAINTAAGLLVSDYLRVRLLDNSNRGELPGGCMILLLFNTDPENIVAVQYNAKPPRMTWQKLIEIVRLTRVWPVTEESMSGPTFPLRVINIKTHSVNNL